MRSLAALSLSLLVTGCGSALHEVGVEPAMSPVGSGISQSVLAAHSYPNEPMRPTRRFSLWDDRQSRLFTDPRALSVGDILTVHISINDRAQFKNESDRSRNASSSFDFGAGFGVGSSSGSAEANFGIGSGTSTKGTGATKRSENIDLRVAAVVTEVLSNGNLIISGSQEVRVNAELRILTITGIVRPSDIGASNTISYERIAEARVSYGGRGRLTEVQQPPYGQQVLDRVLPF